MSWTRSELWLLLLWGVAAVLATICPFWEGGSLASLIMFAPCFVFARRLAGRRPSWLWIGAAGFTLGGLRCAITCGFVFGATESPVLATTIALVWIGLLHAAWALALTLLVRHGRFARILWGGAMVVLLDWALTRPEVLPVPYLSTAYAGADSHLLAVATTLGPFGISFLVGALCTSVSEGRQGVGYSLAIIAIGGAVVVGSMRGERVPSLEVVSFRGGLDLETQSNPQRPDFIILPEVSAISMSPGRRVVEDEQTIEIEHLRRVHSAIAGKPVLVSGVLVEEDNEGEAYRNSILIREADGHEIWCDKRIPTPGGEVDPMASVPLLGRIARHAVNVEGRLITEMVALDGVVVRDLRIATAVCFEHSLLLPKLAWNITDSRPDLLLSVGLLEPLGGGAREELRLSRRARLLHAATFGVPLIYVTEIGSEVVYPTGRKDVRFFGDGRPWAEHTVPLRSSSWSVSIFLANHVLTWALALAAVSASSGLTRRRRERSRDHE